MSEHRSDEDDDVRGHLRTGFVEDAGSGTDDLVARTRRRVTDDEGDQGDDVAGHVSHPLDPKR